MPRQLLRWHSAYFAAALDPEGGFVKEGVKELHIEDNIQAFEAFFCWIFTGKLKDVVPPTDGAKATDAYLSLHTICNVWFFGELRGIPALKNVAIDMLHERCCAKWVWLSGCIKLVYENTVEGSQLRKYIVDMTTRTISVGGILAVSKDLLTVDFLRDILPIYANRAQGGVSPLGQKDWAGQDRCKWHDHSGPGGKLRLESRK